MKTFDEAQWKRLNERRNTELPLTVLDIYHARAILKEGLDDFEDIAKEARVTGTVDVEQLLDGLVDLSARCQQAAEDLNLIKQQTQDALQEKHESLALAFHTFVSLIISKAQRTQPLQQGGKPCVSVTLEQSFLDDIVDKIAQYE